MSKALEYDILDNTAIQLRLDYGFCDDYLDIFKLARKLNMKLIRYSSLSEKNYKTLMNFFKKNNVCPDACTIFYEINNKIEYYTFYDDTASQGRIRFSLAHEIKHVIFGEQNPTEKDEKMANHFARFLLAPPCLVKKYLEYDMDCVASRFGISLEAAWNAYDAANNREWFHIGYNKLEKELIRLNSN